MDGSSASAIILRWDKWRIQLSHLSLMSELLETNTIRRKSHNLALNVLGRLGPNTFTGTSFSSSEARRQRQQRGLRVSRCLRRLPVLQIRPRFRRLDALEVGSPPFFHVSLWLKKEPDAMLTPVRQHSHRCPGGWTLKEDIHVKTGTGEGKNLL